MKYVHLYDYLPSKAWMNYSGDISAPRTYDKVIARYDEFCPDQMENFVLVKDNIESDKFLRTYLKLCNPDKNFCSHILFMQHKDSLKSFFLTDAVMNIEPTSSEIMRITLNAVDFCRKYFHPDDIDYMVHVNLLTNSGHFSLNNPTSSKMELVRKALEGDSRLYITQWQLDTCLYEESRKVKLIGRKRDLSPEIIVAPNLDTGNAIYKALMKDYLCTGFVIGGVVPGILNSRSDLDKNEEAIKILEKYKVIE